MLLLAASCDGASLSAFIRKAALEAARSVVDLNDRFVLSREEAKVIIASFEQPLVPNEKSSRHAWHREEEGCQIARRSALAAV